MAATYREYTPAEAAAVSGIAVKTVHNAIDKRIVSTATSRTGGRALTDDDLLHLKLWYGVGSILSAERRKRLFDAIADDPKAETVRADDYLIVDVARARQQLAARADALREAEAAIHSVKGVAGGDAVFKGTRVPVRAIAGMRAQGAAVEELLDGYPALTTRMIELAEIWTAAHPARGRPKTLSEQGLRLKESKKVPLKSVSRPSAGSHS
ncbi:DUF433 domain-containing protein [Shinella sp. CPCC 100929]|uniref:DUF433 domain-containing protein n=1 Tax=Shinella lacus TaxID=2654216 RepID=A0ABT1RG72_9HYPH|nr:DUF433 domain-containing protein [Shinella lacus]MCQ4633956.1 DUF433 domain-containing protein [Shinella lacus]